ncbi:hypothetical protein CRC_01262 [Cylindrospermopsis raciborskii CS-505]|nr:hypothetical protein [Cylindrospermopsis raciborskii]EFA70074.1 hypothetical protein CRC_01262 [Cylindrospermopsis raciborskii CS-505]
MKPDAHMGLVTRPILQIIVAPHLIAPKFVKNPPRKINDYQVEY